MAAPAMKPAMPPAMAAPVSSAWAGTIVPNDSATATIALPAIAARFIADPHFVSECFLPDKSGNITP
jgi:hypothetical protein